MADGPLRIAGNTEVIAVQKSVCGKFELAQRDSKGSAALVHGSCCDKNVIVIDQNASERSSGKRLKNQVE
jgi:hypothetical protein